MGPLPYWSAGVAAIRSPCEARARWISACGCLDRTSLAELSRIGQPGLGCRRWLLQARSPFEGEPRLWRPLKRPSAPVRHAELRLRRTAAGRCRAARSGQRRGTATCIVGDTPVEHLAVGAPAFSGDGLAQPVAFTLDGAQRTTVCGALAALGLEAHARGGQLLFGNPAPVVGGPELVVVICVAEAFPLPLQDEAAVQVRHARRCAGKL